MTKYAEIIKSYGENNDITAYPYWAIVNDTKGGPPRMVQGIWFNRADAERHLESRRYEYGKKAIVYCFSGHYSTHVRELHDLARDELLAEATN